jgi:peptidyl-tRNA hydrolase ICT1
MRLFWPKKSSLLGQQLLWSFKRNYSPIPEIPRDKLTFTFTHASGPGGQNVNKRNTKVELRFKPSQAMWLSEDLRKAFEQRWRARINQKGEFVISCQKYRTQEENVRNCIHRLRLYLEEADAQLTGRPGKIEMKIKKIQRRKQKQYKRAVKKLEKIKKNDLD